MQQPFDDQDLVVRMQMFNWIGQPHIRVVTSAAGGAPTLASFPNRVSGFDPSSCALSLCSCSSSTGWSACTASETASRSLVTFAHSGPPVQPAFPYMHACFCAPGGSEFLVQDWVCCRHCHVACFCNASPDTDVPLFLAPSTGFLHERVYLLYVNRRAGGEILCGEKHVRSGTPGLAFHGTLTPTHPCTEVVAILLGGIHCFLHRPRCRSSKHIRQKYSSLCF